ncbi:unnamed protein product [Adineta ricciae]|uniref:Uncharacterized protein n=1 Tax=Adineta ricciae TaxID=249248 RepID=A0A813QH38_ADIRI|nr:unnamed protein product [Adineta ricciae]CAF1625399.1 unnamed protein product [Adineta ricciae]
MADSPQWNSYPGVCDLHAEELTDEHLIHTDYCRVCGYHREDHMHILDDDHERITNFKEDPINNFDFDDIPIDSNNSTVPEQDLRGLSKQEASDALDKIWTRLQMEQFAERETELDESSLKLQGQTIRWYECIYSQTKPPTGHSLWISMHGGGGCPAPDNDQQYQNQQKLYDPSEGIWVVPRSPTDSWDMWHQEHIDAMFNRIIENYIMVKEINPNRVYILGYSAGGDGVYQLAPRMADRFAAAAMMAGHPNDALPYGLRNLPFAIYVGENDSAYNRNAAARQWAEQLDGLQNADPNGYKHHVNICVDMGHWMCGRDAEALEWMAQWARNPWPKKIVWVQDKVFHDRFYWLSLPNLVRVRKGEKITAEINEQTITITLTADIQQLDVYLSDFLLNLDEPISVQVAGYGQVYHGRVPRTERAIEQSLRHRADPTCAASAILELAWANF